MGYTSLFSLQETMAAEETCLDSVTVMNTNNHCLFWFEAHLYICFDDVFQWLQASAWCIKPIFVILKWFYISVFLIYLKKKRTGSYSISQAALEVLKLFCLSFLSGVLQVWVIMPHFFFFYSTCSFFYSYTVNLMLTVF